MPPGKVLGDQDDDMDNDQDYEHDTLHPQYKSDAAADVKKMEKFVNNLMRHMASKEHQ